MNLETAREAGGIYANKRRIGSTIDSADAMIAGICKVYGEAILTWNVNQFPASMELALNLIERLKQNDALWSQAQEYLVFWNSSGSDSQVLGIPLRL